MDFTVDLKPHSGDTVVVTTYCARGLLEEFLQAHDVDLNRFPTPSRISVAFGALTFEQYVFDENGKLVVDGNDVKRELVTVPQRAPWPLDTTA